MWRRWWDARSSQMLSGGGWGFRVASGAVAARDGFWWALLCVGYWWSGWETVAGSVRWLLGCRRGEPLPPALADGLDGLWTTRGW